MHQRSFILRLVSLEETLIEKGYAAYMQRMLLLEGILNSKRTSTQGMAKVEDNGLPGVEGGFRVVI